MTSKQYAAPVTEVVELRIEKGFLVFSRNEDNNEEFFDSGEDDF